MARLRKTRDPGPPNFEPINDQNKPSSELMNPKRLANATAESLESFSISEFICHMMRSLTDSISALLDVFTSSTRRMTGFVKCCHSEVVSSPV